MIISSDKISLFFKNEGPYMYQQPPRQLLPMFKSMFTWCRRVTWDYWCGKREGTKSCKKSPGSLCLLAWELHWSSSPCSLPELHCVMSVHHVVFCWSWPFLRDFLAWPQSCVVNMDLLGWHVKLTPVQALRAPGGLNMSNFFIRVFSTH